MWLLKRVIQMNVTLKRKKYINNIYLYIYIFTKIIRDQADPLSLLTPISPGLGSGQTIYLPISSQVWSLSHSGSLLYFKAWHLLNGAIFSHSSFCVWAKVGNTTKQQVPHYARRWFTSMFAFMDFLRVKPTTERCWRDSSSSWASWTQTDLCVSPLVHYSTNMLLTSLQFHCRLIMCGALWSRKNHWKKIVLLCLQRKYSCCFW